MLIHLHPDTEEAFIAFHKENRQVSIFSLFAPQEKFIRYGKVEINSCIEKFCKDCEYFFSNIDDKEDIDDEEDIDNSCGGGRDVIDEGDCEYYDSGDLLVEGDSMSIHIPALLFINTYDSFHDNLINDKLFTIEEANNSFIAVKPYRIGNVDYNGTICWGNANIGGNTGKYLDIVRRWNEFWISPFNSDLMADLYYNVNSLKEYIEKYNSWHAKNNCDNSTVDLDVYDELLPLDSSYKSFFIWDQSCYPICDDDSISISTEELINKLRPLRKTQGVIYDFYDSIGNQLCLYSYDSIGGQLCLY